MRFILGIIAGVVAGMLMAPDRGKRTREKINNEFPRYRKQANDSLNEAIEKTRTVYNDLVNELGLTTEKLEKEKSRMMASQDNMDNTANKNTANKANTGSNTNTGKTS